MKLRRFVAAAFLFAHAGCSSDSDDATTSDGGTGSEASTATGVSSSSDAQTGSATVGTTADTEATGSSGEDTGLAAGPCGDGDLECDAGQACIEETIEPVCTNYDPKIEECPDGTTATACGGPGAPCCCEPALPPEYRCVDAPGCGSVADCACADEPCEGDDVCGALADGTLNCRLPDPA